MKRCKNKPPDPPEVNTRVEERPDVTHAELNRKLIAAIAHRTFSKDEIKQLQDVIREKVEAVEGEPFKLDNGETIRLKDKAKLARRFLLIQRKMQQEEALRTSECPECHKQTRVKVGSEPKDKGTSVIHFYCYTCDLWTQKDI